MEVPHKSDTAGRRGKAFGEARSTLGPFTQIVRSRVSRVPVWQAMTEEAAVQFQSRSQCFEEVEYSVGVACQQLRLRFMAQSKVVIAPPSNCFSLNEKVSRLHNSLTRIEEVA